MGVRQEDCGQLWTDQPLCPQHKCPSSFGGNGQNGFWQRATSCLWLVHQKERDKCLLCVPIEMLLQSEPSSRQLNSSNLCKTKFNMSHKVFQPCHKTAQVALQRFSPLVRSSELLRCPGAPSDAEAQQCPAKPLLVVSLFGSLSFQVFSGNTSCGNELAMTKASNNLYHCLLLWKVGPCEI